MPSTTVVLDLPSAESALLADILYQRGNPRLNLVAALMYETELTLDEICRLTPACFNLQNQDVGVLAADGELMDFAEFGRDTIAEFCHWMAVRRTDYKSGWCFGPLLHDDAGDPATPAGILHEFERIVCQTDAPNDARLNHFDVEMLRALWQTPAHPAMQIG